MPQYEECEELDFGVLSEEEILLIKAEYSRQKLKESLAGPLISTLVHSLLIVMAILFLKGEVVEKNTHVEIVKIEESIPPVEPPPPPPPPEIPPPEPQEVISHDPQGRPMPCPMRPT